MPLYILCIHSIYSVHGAGKGVNALSAKKFRTPEANYPAGAG